MTTPTETAPPDPPDLSDPPDPASRNDPLAATRRWIERAVIGLNLCPFAKAVHVRGQIRCVESAAETPKALLADLMAEMQRLAAADPQVTDTTLIVHPRVLTDFLDYNDFLDVADAALDELGLVGTLQVAGFHPDYRFEGSDDTDPGNRSNRSPFPTLHLLREDSVERAVDAYPDTELIVDRNIETLERLGDDGWQRLLAD